MQRYTNFSKLENNLHKINYITDKLSLPYLYISLVFSVLYKVLNNLIYHLPLQPPHLRSHKTTAAPKTEFPCLQPSSTLFFLKYNAHIITSLFRPFPLAKIKRKPFIILLVCVLKDTHKECLYIFIY